MITVPRMASVLRKVFEQDARALAREMGVIQRERKLTGTTLLLLLVLGWLHEPKAGPSALARFAGTLGVTISKQGIEEHWTLTTAQWLYEVLLRAVQSLISAKGVAIPLLQRFAGVSIEDGSSIRLPDGLEQDWRGCRGGNSQANGTKAAVKLTLRLELKQGTLQGPLLQDGRSHESQSLLQHWPLEKGALWIADLGYFALVRLVQLSKAGVSFLMPLKDRPEILTLIPLTMCSRCCRRMLSKTSRSTRSCWERANRSSADCSLGEPATSKSSAVTAHRTSMRTNMAPSSPNTNATGRSGRWSSAMCRRLCSAWPKPWCCCGCAGKLNWCGNCGKCKGS